MPVLRFEMQQAIQEFIASAENMKVDLSDILIAHSAKFSGCEGVLTFDKKASKFKRFKLLQE